MIRASGLKAGALVSAIYTAGLLAGCVYYNGMYNANRLAGSARKAEREGRTFEANNLWGQVATKAESVVVRHPRSKYAEEASILRGLALAKLGQCEQALTPLSRVGVAKLKSDLKEDVWLASGRCHVTLGNIAAADAAFAQVINSRNAARQREAKFQRAQTLRALGRYEEALAELHGSKEPRAVSELLLSLAGAGRHKEAMVLADSLVATGDTTQPWDSLVTALGRQDPSNASSLVDRVRRLPQRSPEMQARWLLEDGRRLARRDTARAVGRFREAVRVGGAGAAGAQANLELLRLEIGRASRSQDLASSMEALRNLGQKHPTLAEDVNQLRTTALRVMMANDSVIPGLPQGDLRLFLVAEAARDSLRAPRLARDIFLRIVNEWPESPYAPKAVLAAQQLDPEWADSARALLETRYPDSPYLAVTRGEEAFAYQLLEDSLGAFAAATAVPARRGRARPGEPSTPTPDDAEETPGRRRTQPRPPVRGVQP
jgi:tetratricopeptide (TPR) repeat protein